MMIQLLIIRNKKVNKERSTKAKKENASVKGTKKGKKENQWV